MLDSVHLAAEKSSELTRDLALELGQTIDDHARDFLEIFTRFATVMSPHLYEVLVFNVRKLW